MAVGSGRVRSFGGPAKKVNPIPRDHDNTSDEQRKVTAVRNKRKFAAPDSSTPGRIVTAPPHTETTMPG